MEKKNKRKHKITKSKASSLPDAHEPRNNCSHHRLSFRLMEICLIGILNLQLYTRRQKHKFLHNLHFFSKERKKEKEKRNISKIKCCAVCTSYTSLKQPSPNRSKLARQQHPHDQSSPDPAATNNTSSSEVAIREPSSLAKSP